MRHSQPRIAPAWQIHPELSMPKPLYWLSLLFVASIPFQEVLLYVYHVETYLKPYRLVVLAMLAVHLAVVLTGQRRFTLRPLAASMILLFSWGFLLAIAHVIFGTLELNYQRTIDGLLVMGFPFTCFLIFQSYEIEKRRLQVLLIVFLVASVVASMLAEWLVTDHTLRTRGFYQNPNRYAMSLVLAGAVTIYLAARSRTLLVQASYAGLFLLLCGQIFVSGSRGAMVSLATVLIGYLLIMRMRLATRVAISAVAGAAFLSISVLNLNPVAVYSQFGDSPEVARMLEVRYSAEDVSDGSGRFDLWRSGWLVAQDSFFLGVGYNSYRSLHADYISEIELLNKKMGEREELALHSDLMTMLVEFGLLGMLFYYFTMFGHFTALFRRSAMMTGNDHLLFTTIVAGFFGIFMQGFLRNSFLTLEYWWFLALTVSLLRVRYQARSPVPVYPTQIPRWVR